MPDFVRPRFFAAGSAGRHADRTEADRHGCGGGRRVWRMCPCGGGGCGSAQSQIFPWRVTDCFAVLWQGECTALFLHTGHSMACFCMQVAKDRSLHSPLPRSSASHLLAHSLSSLYGYARSGTPRADTISTWLAFTAIVRSARGSERAEERTGTAYLTPRKNLALGRPASATSAGAHPPDPPATPAPVPFRLRPIRLPAGKAGR